MRKSNDEDLSSDYVHMKMKRTWKGTLSSAEFGTKHLALLKDILAEITKDLEVRRPCYRGLGPDPAPT